MDVQEARLDAQQREALVAAAKLLWGITTDDENDPDVKAAVTAALGRAEPDSMTQVTSLNDQTSHSPDAAVHRMIWPQMDLEFWRSVESLLDVESGIVLDGDDAFNAWFASVIQSRPVVR